MKTYDAARYRKKMQPPHVATLGQYLTQARHAEADMERILAEARDAGHEILGDEILPRP